ncbi:vespryn-like [Paroedura picta]|uniref:vespryn-like n=1 Tax=Paroedura picta TaxID=143630 RepID=UPI004057B487
MPRSVDSPLCFRDFPSTNCSLWTFKGLSFILWLSLCLLAGCEGSKQVPAAFLRKNYRTKVTFDPNTAYPWLVVSADRTYVESGDRPQNVPDNPERFNSTPAVLGLPGFTSGKHYWEVEYGDQREWAVGVALESVDRKGNLGLSPKEGIWKEGRWWLRALETHSHTRSLPPGIIGVFLDYKEGTVAFYTEHKVILKKASFNGEKVFPFFYMRGGVHLKLRQ